MTGEHCFSRARTDGSVVAASSPLERPLRTLACAGHFPVSMAHENPLRIPEPLRQDVEQLFKLTDPFCGEHLNAEYAELVRKLIAKLARKRPSPLARGDLRIWAAAAIYAVGSVNFLFDRTQRPHLTGDDLSALTGVPKITLANKAKLIHDVLRIGQMQPEFCRQELLASNPMAWMISVDGFIVDARTMPPEVQAEARRRGLIPDLPATMGARTAGSGDDTQRPRNLDSEWQHKGATLSDKTARKEFGLTQDEIVQAIRAGKLHCREASMHGNPWLRLLRREVEALIKKKHGDDYLKVQQAKTGFVTLSNLDAKIDHIGPPGRAQLQRIELAP